MESDLVVRIRQALDEMDRCVAERVEAAACGVPSKTPFKILSLRESLGHRLADLGRTALDLFEGGRPIGACILTRAVLETSAQLFALNHLVQAAVQRQSAERLDEQVTKLLLGSRAGWTSIVATNVLTLVDKMDREYPGSRTSYEELSEVCHPNLAGGIGGYGRADQGRWTVVLTRPARGHVAEQAGLPALATSLFPGIESYDRIAPVFSGLARLCHETTKVERGNPSGNGETADE